MFRRDKIDIVHIPNILEFDIPFPQLFWCQILAVSLMGDVVVLAKHASKVAPRKEDATWAIVSLDAWF